MNEPNHDLYGILGVQRTATTAEIRRAYRDRARRAHPDVAAPTNIGDMASINDAWSVLGDVHRRAAYDRTLGQISVGASTDNDEEPYWAGHDRPSAVLSRPTQRLLKSILIVSMLALAVVMVAIFLIGFGRVGA